MRNFVYVCLITPIFQSVISTGKGIFRTVWKIVSNITTVMKMSFITENVIGCMGKAVKYT